MLEKKILTLKETSNICKNYSILLQELREANDRKKGDNNLYRKIVNAMSVRKKLKALQIVLDLEEELKSKFVRFEKFNKTVQNNINREFFENQLSNFKEKISSISLDINSIESFEYYVKVQFNSIFTSLWKSLEKYLEVQNKYIAITQELEKPSNHLFPFEKERYELLAKVKYEKLNTKNQFEILEDLEMIEIEYSDSLEIHRKYINQIIDETKTLKDTIHAILKMKDYISPDVKNEIQSIRHDISDFESKLMNLDYNSIDLIILDNRLNQIKTEIDVLDFSQKVLEINKKSTKTYLSLSEKISKNKNSINALKSSIDRMQVVQNYNNIDEQHKTLLKIKSVIQNHLGYERNNN